MYLTIAIAWMVFLENNRRYGLRCSDDVLDKMSLLMQLKQIARIMLLALSWPISLPLTVSDIIDDEKKGRDDK